jgi:hypothetical protein
MKISAGSENLLSSPVRDVLTQSRTNLRREK